MNELNEKMLKFAGFRALKAEKKFYTPTFPQPTVYEVEVWEYPNGDIKEEPPDFPNDLNACFEHLEPELYRRGFRYDLTRVHDGHRAIIFAPGRTWADMVAYAVDEKPATAFCKAVEQLIEKHD